MRRRNHPLTTPCAGGRGDRRRRLPEAHRAASLAQALQRQPGKACKKAKKGKAKAKPRPKKRGQVQAAAGLKEGQLLSLSIDQGRRIGTLSGKKPGARGEGK